MESSGQRPAEPEVPLADAAIATKIARAAARGRGADRSPTLEQLLAAFGEGAPTDAARRRVRAALQVTGMDSRPDVLDAEPGQRLLLLPPGTAKGPSRGRALGGLLALAALLVAAVAAAALLGTSNDTGNRASDDLPATSTNAATTTTTTTTGKTPAVVGATTTTLTPPPTESGTTPASTTAPTADEKAAEVKRKRRQRARRKRAQEARRREAAAAERRRSVVVRVDATGRPTFLCVDDGRGHQLFGGTLDGRKTFKARRVRMNIGLASTRVTVDGTPVTLDGSPTGLDITRRGGARTLPLGSRPCA
jgi:hypothetical protein